MRRRLAQIVAVILGVLFSLGLTVVLTGVVSSVADLFPDSWWGTAAFAVLALALIAWMSYDAHRDWVKEGRPKTKVAREPLRGLTIAIDEVTVERLT